MRRPSVPDLSTLAIHGGKSIDPATGAILVPVHQSATYVQSGLGGDPGYTYSRSANPTVAALERALGALEDAPAGIAFASGMAALTALFLSGCRGGDHVVCGRAVYGGTQRLLRRILAPLGIATDFVDARDPASVAAALTDRTRVVLIESPANPGLELADVAALSEAAHARGALLAIDNTFCTPVLQRPLDLGADLSLYSTTKFIEGHNATIGGAIVSRDPDLVERLRFVRNATGSIMAPWTAWLTLRGIKTLPLRMDAHSRTAIELARFLESRPEFVKVRHPDLDSFPQAELARRQMKAGGGLVTVEVVGGLEGAAALVASLRVASLAESLGAVETLVTHPATMTHASISAEERERAGISDGLVRISVGLERPEDLIADFRGALTGGKGGRR